MVKIIDAQTIIPITITCKGSDIEISALRLINDDIDEIIQDLRVETVLKEKLNAIVFTNEELKLKRIKIRKLKKEGLDGRTINMFLRLLEYVDTV